MRLLKSKLLLTVVCLALIAVMAGCGSAKGGNTSAEGGTQAVAQTLAEGEVQTITQSGKEESANSPTDSAVDKLELPDDVFTEADIKADETDNASDNSTAVEEIIATQSGDTVAEKDTEPQEAEPTKQVMDYNSKGEGIVLPDDVWE